MTIRYPNGNQFHEQPASSNLHNDSIDFSNRGMTLEDEINKSNQYYLREGIAVVHKSRPQFKLFPLIIPSEVLPESKRLIFAGLQRLTTMVFTVENILTLMPRKLRIRLLSH